MMRAVILAAGAGTRLNGGGVTRPKCLADFDGVPLIHLQLRALRWCGIDNIVVVVGFEAERVRRSCGSGVQFVENRDYLTTNSLYSLWLARPLLGNGFVVMNCDVLFHPRLLLDLIEARHENALLVSFPAPDDEPFGEEEMKVSVKRGRVTDIRKDLPLSETDAENLGIGKFSDRGAARLLRLMDGLVASGCTRDWAPRAFREFARVEPLYAIGTRGLPWTEIDTADDYRFATQHVYPAMRDAIEETAAPLRRGA